MADWLLGSGFGKAFGASSPAAQSVSLRALQGEVENCSHYHLDSCAREGILSWESDRAAGTSFAILASTLQEEAAINYQFGV